ncbi:hypothetical protein COL940_006724 [Colletotrichum noveboracense]|nr:hypothetical protein COL940_006724 [Colletotrichum noveboracense]
MSQALTLCSRRHHDESIRQSIKALQEEQNTLESELEKAQRHQLNKSESSKRRQKADDLSQRLADLRTQIKARKEITLFNDYTRRIDLLWVLEYSDQAAWAADAFKSLQELDPKNV